MYTLITIPFSHYNEKARWALDRYGVPYHERPVLPMLHMPVVWWATRNQGENRADSISSPFSTPVMIFEDGRVLCDSSDIVRYVSSHHAAGAGLYQTPEAGELAQYFDDRLGAHTRRVVYYHVLPSHEHMLRLTGNNASATQATLFRMLYPGIRRAMTRGLHVTAERTERSLARIREVFADVATRLDDGRPYLAGDTFSAADLSFAALAAPALLINRDEGYGAWIPSRAEAPAPLAELAEELRATRAGRFAMKMYQHERRTRARLAA